MSTKSDEQRRRASKKTSRDLVVSLEKSTSTSQAEFLSNSCNKTQIIGLLSQRFKAAGFTVQQADGDADPLIVKTALQYLHGGRNVIVASTDTDVLAMLLAHAKPGDKMLHVLHPASSKSPGKVYDVAKVQMEIGVMKDNVLFAHAMTGCDTTSALFSKGKKTAWNVLLNHSDMREVAAVFMDPAATKNDIVDAGEKFVLKLYGEKGCKNLDELRCLHFARALTRRTAIELEMLPPTTAACKQHALRVYLQVCSSVLLTVQQWCHNQLSPTDWGWRLEGDSLVPVTSELMSAPEFLLEMVACGCKQGCGARCSCRVGGLNCTMMCLHCKGHSCVNGEPVHEGEEDPDDPDVL
ncbi:hypothetical protein ONE63_011176 [Megalurothrips usitatus]|uniref:Tesmin/TSO1-like CXC domain-containing protein n=1 Tax=Megalurothrips usitatus TaxID=439358 RepID=A0AAV7X472_9NEOP|nr:hypothetical protein ONE63_011176 [Megalurothrips usitatus]